MGIDQIFKEATRTLFVEGWTAHTRRAFRVEAAATSNRQSLSEENTRLTEPATGGVYLIDATYMLKYSSAGLRTGRDFVDTKVLQPVIEFFEQGGDTVYLCFDLKSPQNKAIEQAKRYRKVTPMLTPPPGVPLTDDHNLPPHTAWREFSSNHFLVAELKHYIAHAVLDEVQGAPQLSFTPPAINGRLFVHGLRLESPIHPHTEEPGRGTSPRSSSSSSVRRTSPLGQDGRRHGGRQPLGDPELLFVHNCPVTRHVPMGAQTRSVTTVERRAGADPGADRAVLRELREGEIAVAYFAAQNPDRKCVFRTPDGDLLLILLLMARDRILPNNTWRNRHLLRLDVPLKGPDIVDINALYSQINEASDLMPGVTDRVLSWCALGMLVKSDYIQNFAYGIGTWKSGAHETLCDMPFVLRTFLEHPHEFGTMFQIVTPRGDQNRPLEPLINEDKFILFARMIYVTKYWPRMVRLAARMFEYASGSKRSGARSEMAVDRQFKWSTGSLQWARAVEAEPETCEARIALTVTFLLQQMRANPKCHMMPVQQIRVFMRQLQWLLEYSLNGYRGTCRVESPIHTLDRVPYYGWEIDNVTGQISASGIVACARTTSGGHAHDKLLRRSASDLRAPALPSMGAPPAWIPRRDAAPSEESSGGEELPAVPRDTIKRPMLALPDDSPPSKRRRKQ